MYVLSVAWRPAAEPPGGCGGGNQVLLLRAEAPEPLRRRRPPPWLRCCRRCDFQHLHRTHMHRLCLSPKAMPFQCQARKQHRTPKHGASGNYDSGHWAAAGATCQARPQICHDPAAHYRVGASLGGGGLGWLGASAGCSFGAAVGAGVAAATAAVRACIMRSHQQRLKPMWNISGGLRECATTATEQTRCASCRQTCGLRHCSVPLLSWHAGYCDWVRVACAEGSRGVEPVQDAARDGL